MSEWKLVTLGSVCFINPKESLAKGMIAKKVGMEYLQPFTKNPIGHDVEAYNGGTKFRNGDTLVARITPCLENGKTCYISNLSNDEIAFGSTEYIVLREKPTHTDKEFLYYFARSDLFRDVAIASMTGSSGRQRVQTDVVINHEFNIPPLPEQKAIASVLSSLDDKIDLLHRQNKTLEAMAETLFQQWFVEEAKEDWEEVKLKDYVAINKKSITKDYSCKEIQYLDTGSITKGNISSLQTYSRTDSPSRARRLVSDNDILISTVRPNQHHYGIVDNPPENLVVSTGFCTITCEKISPYFIYIMLTTSEMTEYLHSIAEGSTSTYPSLKPEDISTLSFKYPNEMILTKFHKTSKSFWEKRNNNQKQIQTLEKLRDTLLPKLMSGEVRVQY
ncbi:restriction endonuclease subunit S [Acinetobacter rathckeae]|uniref:restriction endonuclease subunit S n=1 Tax=Acinetobacter rathckeae TaxID=2605272 RepID=UPI0018A25C06|nr:restriction endonuclease subunit S [Acinetobacter rathckeae]MBF7695122.1 restriction endonuclease subunit S [Acinetobacter rathckeae]